MSAVRKFLPLADRVLVKRAVVETKSAGGLLLPETGKKKNEGEVVAVGPGAMTREGTRIAPAVAAGDLVLLPEYGGHAIDLGEEDVEFMLFREEDLLGKFDRE